MKRLAVLALAVLVPFNLSSAAEEKLSCPICKGWYWTDIPKKDQAEKGEVKEAPLELPPVTVPPALSETLGAATHKDKVRKLVNMHPDQFSVLYTAYIKKGVWKSTPENLTDVYTVQKAFTVKSQAYASTAMAVVSGNPELSLERDIPLDPSAQKMMKDAERAEMRARIAREKENWLLVYFKSETCPVCRAQKNANRMFYVDTGMQVKEIDLDTAPESPALMGVDEMIPGYAEARPQVPVILLGYKTREMKDRGEEPKYHPIAAGAITADEMAERVYRAMRLLSGEITEEQWAMYELQRGGNLDPQAVREGGKP